MKKILFVCTGNTCRSCMAEAIANKILREDKKNAEIIVSSAGIYAHPGERASSEAALVMAEYGMDLAGHIAKRADRELLREADIILTMTDSHKSMILNMDRSMKNKVYTLGEYIGAQSRDIEDPYGQCVEEYRKCAGQLKEYITSALDKIMKEE